MKDNMEIGHLTKFDAFRMNRDKVMDLQMWYKIYTNISNFETASPKTISSLKTLIFFTVLRKLETSDQLQCDLLCGVSVY